MKKIKILFLLILCIICTTNMCVYASATLDPNDYISICTEITEDELIDEIELETLEAIDRFSDYYNDVEVDLSAVTFSDFYYAYDFYKVEPIENKYIQIIFENSEIIGISWLVLTDELIYPQIMFGDYEFIAEGLENESHMLFGSAIVNGFSCGLFYIDGIIYTDAADILGVGKTDLVFGEIPYSKELGGVDDDEPIVTVVTTHTTEVMGAIGNVNMDEKISLLDIIHLNRIIIGAIDLNEQQVKFADCNADGIVNDMDIKILIQYILEIVDTLPVIAA